MMIDLKGMKRLVLSLMLAIAVFALGWLVPAKADSDLSGSWDGWGGVQINGNRGTYQDTYGGRPGTMSFMPHGHNTYLGRWGESDARHGIMTVTVSEDGNSAKVEWKPDADSTIGSQAGGTETWTRKGPSRSTNDYDNAPGYQGPGSQVVGGQYDQNNPVSGPSLNGTWNGWGGVQINGNRGTYQDTYGGRPGTMSFMPHGHNTYLGRWGESDARHGIMTVTVSEDGNSAKVEWKPDADCTIGSQAGGTETWTRK